MFKKIRKFFTPKHIISEKGKYLAQYCKLITEDKWTEKDYIQAYEDDIDEIASIMIDSGVSVTRKEAAELVLSILEELIEE